jgi:dTMP kinase
VTFAAPFIVLEGPEGAGKSHQAGILSAWLREQGWKVVQTREPGGTAAGDAIRAILLQSSDLHLLPETEALLMSAARAQHVRETVIPALEQGKAVVCDRYVDSTYAYQGGGSEIPLDLLRPLQEFATDGLKPDIRLLLDVPVEIGLGRRHGDAAQVNRIDRAPVDFHQRVRAAFLHLAAADPDGWIVIDATATIDDVSKSIRAAVESWLVAFAGKGMPT